ncbi:hypothetical protein DFQ27_004341 [Actinomortierella ambigua]|uniref:Uncharacterized protein n=1 Tax=Actinomortierella ambigua TaxID=1343610 RepID=A0A9P6U3L0_9FUNG|nr:hypothetical protein DFQ27_004341 [Actinomortierella ambigua]
MLQRSVEIMIPPGHTASTQSNPICPTMPDGPIYIHHRSALPNTPLQRALHSTHLENEYRHQPLQGRPQASSSSTSLEYTFLQNQVDVIDGWLFSMREKPAMIPHHKPDQ